MQILIWILSVGGLVAMYWGFRVDGRFWVRMATLAFVGAVFLSGIAAGLDSVWFNATGIAILAIAFWPTPKKPEGEPTTPSASDADEDGKSAKPE